MMFSSEQLPQEEQQQQQQQQPPQQEEAQTAQLKFSVNLLFGFESVVTKTEIGLQVVRDLIDFYKKRQQVELDYAKQLQQLYKTKPGTGLFSKEVALSKETKTLRETVFTMLDKGVIVSDKHSAFGGKINNDIIKVMEQWVKTKDPERKKIIADGQKICKSLQDLEVAHTRSKSAYETAMRESEALKDKLLQAEKEESNQKDNKKLQQNTQKASQLYTQQVEKCKTLDAQYQAAVTKYNSELEVFQSERMPAVLDQLQQIEEERWNLIVNTVKSVMTEQSSMLPEIDVVMKELASTIEKASIEEDYKDFVEQHMHEAKQLVVYTPFKGKYTETKAQENNEVTAETGEHNSSV